MQQLRISLLFALLIVNASVLAAREAKEFDADVNYDEARLPHYDLPPLLVTGDGKPVTTSEQWFEIRRPQIMGFSCDAT